MPETQTTAQVIVDYSTGELITQQVGDYRKWRMMRRQPTIALARKFGVGPILASTWTVEGKVPQAVEFVEQQILPLRSHLLRTSLFGITDFGWKIFEKIFRFENIEFTDGTILLCQVLDQVKPLRNDDTRIRYVRETGQFLGMSHVNRYTGQKIFIDAPHTLFVNFDDEGLGEYAESRMSIVEGAYDDWKAANESAQRYDKKMAGTFLEIRFPVGKSMLGGVLTDNGEIAERIGRNMLSNGFITIPIDVQDLVTNLQKINEAWKITFHDSQAQQGNFVDRQKYLDGQMVRAFGITERAILEGSYGTKAEAGEHADATLLNMQLDHEMLTEFFNCGLPNRQEGLVDQLLTINGWPAGSAKLVAMPLSDDRYEIFQAVLTQLLADAGTSPELLDKMDIDSMLHTLKIPVAASPDLDPATEADDSYGTEQDVADYAATTNGYAPALMLGGLGSGPREGDSHPHAGGTAVAKAASKTEEARSASGKAKLHETSNEAAQHLTSSAHLEAAKAYRDEQKAHSAARAAHIAVSGKTSRQAYGHYLSASLAGQNAKFHESWAKHLQGQGG